jgi:hypothetical protein
MSFATASVNLWNLPSADVLYHTPRLCNTFMRPLISDTLRVMWKPRPSVHVSVAQYHPIFMSTLPTAAEQD